MAAKVSTHDVKKQTDYTNTHTHTLVEGRVKVFFKCYFPAFWRLHIFLRASDLRYLVSPYCCRLSKKGWGNRNANTTKIFLFRVGFLFMKPLRNIWFVRVLYFNLKSRIKIFLLFLPKRFVSERGTEIPFVRQIMWCVKYCIGRHTGRYYI